MELFHLMQSNPAAEDYEPLPPRFVRARDGRYINISGLNEAKEPTGDPTDDEIDDDEPDPQDRALSGWVRLKICERMLMQVTPYKDTLDKWIAHYHKRKNYRNESALKFVRTISKRLVYHWYYTIATQPREMQKLRDDVNALPPELRYKRCRFDPLSKQRWGTCPFAERFVVEKRKRMVHQSGDHGYTWCTNEFNRVIRCPWMWSIARNYVSEREGRKWASRGTTFKQHTERMKVCCLYSVFGWGLVGVLLGFGWGGLEVLTAHVSFYIPYT